MERFEEQIDQIWHLLPERGRLMGAEQVEVHALLGKLKNALGEEARRSDFSQAEEQWYAPAIREATVHIRIKKNSIPDWRWFDSLGTAASDLVYMRHNLQTYHAEQESQYNSE